MYTESHLAENVRLQIKNGKWITFKQAISNKSRKVVDNQRQSAKIK